MTDHLSNLRPRKSKSEISLSDLACPILLPAALFVTSSSLRVLSNSLALSAWIVYLLDFRSTGRTGGFPWLSFMPAWLCIATSPGLTESRFRLYLAFWTVLIYRPVFNRLIKTFKQSFTFGEGSIICQCLLLLMHSSILRLQNLQSYRTIFLARQVAAWMSNFQQQFSSPTSLILISSWILLSVLSVLVVIVYKYKNWKVTTATRKIFHASVLFVYIPGLIFEPMLLYYCSVIATLLFTVTELLRWSEKLPFLTSSLSTYLKHFTDDKEGGTLILTNIYLLIGVSLPLWLWPGTLDKPITLPVFAGLISVGIGDAASSLVGSKLGRVKLFGGDKTLEGLTAGFLAQFAAAIILDSKLNITDIDFQDPRVLLISSGCLVTSLVELAVDQVDNLILPLVMYSAFVFVDNNPYILS